ncbi:MAG: carbamate kinase [Candidatus Cloacimonadota bacterium]|nr:MAG: carbamate kinase [Candidatus Cloacimonadota bacterium]PIE78236.1 MAG: carbamate kinase [Candidatus Delongbacteria bacterium]
MYNKKIVVAIGGNSLTPTDDNNWISSQFKNARTTVDSIIPLIKDNYKMVITHGNGPQVGVALRRVDETKSFLPEVPLGVLVADTQGSLGYMIEQSLVNSLRKENIDIDVATLVTQVVVDKNDPKLKDPTKFVGSFYTEEEAKKLEEEYGWIIKKDANRGWRRVVGSPKPVNVQNFKIIEKLLNSDNIVIATGGGGVPCFLDENGNLEGVDAVIDKDFASAKVANQIGADELYILTAVDKVAINFGKPNQEDLLNVTVSELQKYLDEGQFPAGSMGPKVEAAIEFLNNGGKRVIITAIDKLVDAIEGKNGTSITV